VSALGADLPVVTVGLPIRNGADEVSAAIESVLAQSFGDFELVISDNASTDRTEAVCRTFAERDSRVVYHRQPENIGLIDNFNAVIRLGRGEYFCWLGDDDRLHPDYLARGVEVLRANSQCLLATTETSLQYPDGRRHESKHLGHALQSSDPVARLAELLRLFLSPTFDIDPISAIVRRSQVAAIPMRKMLRSDQVFAVELALAGPWCHVPQVLAYTRYVEVSRADLARRLKAPVWKAKFATAIQGVTVLGVLRGSTLSRAQKWRGRLVVAKWYVGWHRRRVANKLGVVLGAITHRHD
jgi:glycosyltransferase involved in cell wall biosynthesis